LNDRLNFWVSLAHTYDMVGYRKLRTSKADIASTLRGIQQQRQGRDAVRMALLEGVDQGMIMTDSRDDDIAAAARIVRATEENGVITAYWAFFVLSSITNLLTVTLLVAFLYNYVAYLSSTDWEWRDLANSAGPLSVSAAFSVGWTAVFFQARSIAKKAGLKVLV
jgi:hypothetical protein